MNIVFANKRIKELRENLGLNVLQFARLLGTSRQIVFSWEAGDTMPNLASLTNICNKTNTPESYFFVEMPSLQAKQVSQ